MFILMTGILPYKPPNRMQGNNGIVVTGYISTFRIKIPNEFVEVGMPIEGSFSGSCF